MSHPEAISVLSEVGRLRHVVVQPPGPALERMLPAHIDPGSSEYALFDDLVHVPRAREEHDGLREVLSAVARVDVLEDLVAEVLAKPAARADVLERVAVHHRLRDADARRLEGLDAEALTQTLIVGTLGGTLDGPELFAPLPNLIFTRDLAAVTGRSVVVGSASKQARRRESVLTWALVEHHPLFATARVSETSRWVGKVKRSAPLTVEGGDVLVVSPQIAMIGASERTTWSMIIRLGEELLVEGFTCVLVVEMPKQRSAMHLDTVFTLVDRHQAVVFPPLLEPGALEEAHVVRLRREGEATVVEATDGDLVDALRGEGIPMEGIPCGGGHPVHARREQWTDGANYVALGPGVVVGYARNTHTAREMSTHGFRVVSPRAFLSELERDYHGDPDALFASGRRYAIHLEGSELCRGRGGPRCLTLPLRRDA
jgi:arginine deiminase